MSDDPQGATPETFADVFRECDLVMRGGITSGVVYPEAIITLAANGYRFRSIGGTSAGAIAAAATAAAEYGRLGADGAPKPKHSSFPRGPGDDGLAGFSELRRVVGELTAPHMLANLFQPAPPLRPLLNSFVGYLEAERHAENQASAAGARPQQVALQIPPEAALRSARPGERAPRATLGPLLGWAFGRLRGPAKPGASRPLAEIAELALALLTLFSPDSRARGQSSGARVGTLAGLAAGALLGVVALLAALVASAAGGGALLAGALSGLALLVVLVLIGGLLGRWAGAQLGAPVGVLQASFEAVAGAIAANAYGICKGKKVEEHAQTAFFTPAGDAAAQAGDGLTDWLADVIDRLAGLPKRTRPLTFGDLGGYAFPQQLPGLPPEQQIGIELKMVTTNLSQGRPHVLPFDNEPGWLFFEEGELSQFFPEYVLDHLKRHARVIDDFRHKFAGVAGEAASMQGEHYRDWRIEIADASAPGGRLVLRPLPQAHDLPVVVATRMSLSFPVLLSAVPLWTVSDAAFERAGKQTPVTLGRNDVQCNWFSDGGICSNFPIHFFDRWFPARPTFGINLGELDETLPAAQQHVGSAQTAGEPSPATPDKWRAPVYMPTAFRDTWLSPRWSPIESGMLGFLKKIFYTSLNYRDTMQSLLPSYNDRIVTIRLRQNEGGLNLNMAQETIQRLTELGGQAGQAILRFQPELHQWVRLRLLLNELEEQLAALDAELLPGLGGTDRVAFQQRLDPLLKELLYGEQAAPAIGANTVRQLLEAQRTHEAKFPYELRKLSGDQQFRLDLLLAMMIGWGINARGEPSQVFRSSGGPATERLTMRITPDL